MSKILTLIFALMIILSNVVGASAATIDKNEIVHELGGKEGGITIQGTSPPSSAHPWDLKVGPYNFSHNFDSNLYSNSMLKTSTGSIKFTITSEASEYYAPNTVFYFELWRDSTRIGRVTCKRDGTTTGAFNKLDKTKLYWFKLSKFSNDGIWLSGTGSVTQ